MYHTTMSPGCTTEGIYVLSVPRSTIAYNKTRANLGGGIYMNPTPAQQRREPQHLKSNNAPGTASRSGPDTGVQRHSRIIGSAALSADGTGTQTFGIRVADADNHDVIALNDSAGSSSAIYI